jgi:hypothetical protein
MTAVDTLDRDLAAYLHGEAVAPAPAGLFGRVVGATSGHRPRPAIVARLHDAAGRSAGFRWPAPSARLALAMLLIILTLAAIVAGVLLGLPRPYRDEFTITDSATPGIREFVVAARGRAFVIGGRPPDGDEIRTVIEVFDGATGRFERFGILQSIPLSATSLDDGRILVLERIGSTTAVELIDPDTGVIQSTSAPVFGLDEAPVKALADGRAFIDGQRPVILDPDTGTVEPVHGDPDRRVQLATSLDDGRVLTVSAIAYDDASAPLGPPSVDVFDPATLSFASAGVLPATLYGMTATRLADGRVLFAGGATSIADGSYVPSREAWLFDPATMRFTATGSLTAARWMHSAALLRDGRVLIVGGDIDSARLYRAERSTEIYDPASGTFSAGPSMVEARMNPGTATLADGSVIVVGHHQLVPGEVLAADGGRAARPGSAEVFR